MRVFAVAILLLCALGSVVSGCGSDRAQRGEGTVAVVATTSTLADLARNAGGVRVEVRALVPRLADPHSWRPGPRARAALEDADLVIRAGGDLDAWVEPALEGRSDGAVLDLLPKLDPIGDDPHWWQDPVRTQQAVKEIRNALARVDVDGAGYYEVASGDYLARLRRLDRETAWCIAAAGARGTRMVTQHAGFRYFDDRYGTQLRSPDASGRAKAGRRLWADALGPAGSSASSYVGAFAVNVEAITDAVSEGKRRCRPRV